MTNQEITETIATKVMGWEVVGMAPVLYGACRMVVNNDKDDHRDHQLAYVESCVCDTIDAAEVKESGLVKIGDHYHYCLRPVPDFLNDDRACMMAWDKFSWIQPTELHRGPDEWSARVRRGQAEWSKSSDRKRAMCECMAQEPAE
jgi:hypothetical protein